MEIRHFIFPAEINKREIPLYSCHEQSHLNRRHAVFWDGELPGVSRQLPVVQQRRVSVFQRGRLPVVSHWGVPVVHRRLAVIGEWRLADVRFDVLSGLDL